MRDKNDFLNKTKTIDHVLDKNPTVNSRNQDPLR